MSAVEEEEDSERTRWRADWMESRSGGLRRCSSNPVRVRMKMLPRFSNVHISVVDVVVIRSAP
ncbi:hypothetical protein RHMOL_Rhmol09G0222600 [Rhododendron molle]|uniref:Uncharacterized protein n=1 Tax=Rhododendron molle TaxID=49168 RepID=A0ACC0MFX3_RHOML|nr:hypothetical protein RHMOL_Rhmol09G0222600 [Rhododendron molle]